MTWLRAVIRLVLGHTRYHDQANAMQARTLRLNNLERRLLVIQRGRK